MRVVGRFAPTTAKLEFEIVAVFTITGAAPVELKVSVCIVDAPTITVPKLKLPVLNPKMGSGVVVPIPLSGSVIVLLELELLLIVSCPLAIPVAFGLNCTCRVSDWFGFRIAGRAPFIRENPTPLRVAELMVSGDVPVDVRVNVCVDDESTVTLPKSRLFALTDICTVDFVEPCPRP